MILTVAMFAGARVGGGATKLAAGEQADGSAEIMGHDGEREPGGVGHEPRGGQVLSQHGVPIAPSGYYAFKSRPASARAARDELLLVGTERIFHDRNLGRGLAGARKMWRLLA